MNINMKIVKSKFLHKAPVLVNSDKCAKFQLPRSISYGDMEESKKIEAADLLRRALAGKLLHVAIIPANGYQHIPNFNFLDRLVSEIWGAPKIKKVGAPDFPKCPLADKFLYRALVRVNAYKCAKFQLPSSIRVESDQRGLPPNRGNITPLWLFLVILISFIHQKVDIITK